MKKHNKMAVWRNQSNGDKFFDIFVWIFSALAFIICLYPLYYVVIISFSEQIVGTYLFPQGFTLEGYKMIFEDPNLWIGYGNTIINTVLGVICGLAVTLPGAYALSRKDLVGRNIFTTILMITMFIGGGLIPTYLTVYNLGLTDTRWAVILVSLTSTYNVIVARTFFANSIPGELYDAASIDGCGNGRFFVSVVLPLSKPIIAVIALYIGVDRWNSYFDEMVYLRDKALSTLSLVLRRLLWSVEALEQMIEAGLITDVSESMAKMELATVMQFCLIVVSSAPMMIVYPHLQKYFAKGTMIGSVKG